jgi:hypothetical protein
MAPLSVLCKPVGCCTIAQELPELTLNIAGLGGEKPVCAITPDSVRALALVVLLQSNAAIYLHAARPKAELA